MSSAIAFLVVDPDGTINLLHEPLGVKQAMDIVAGDIDILPQPRDVAVTLIANAEGRNVGLEPNWGATRLIKSSLRPSDFVTGKVIICGLPDAAGDLTGLDVKTEQAVRLLLKADR
jgi:hypothetical protein